MQKIRIESQGQGSRGASGEGTISGCGRPPPHLLDRGGKGASGPTHLHPVHTCAPGPACTGPQVEDPDSRVRTLDFLI